MRKKMMPFLSAVFSALLTGCAAGRGTLHVSVPVPPDPSAGALVRVLPPTDSRVFELKPAKPSIPSLKDGNISDKSITGRAIARKRNGYGMAMGDIVLPEGQTVSALVQAVLVRAFRESGYRASIAAEGESPAGALDVRADIQTFWAWFTPGFFTVDTNCIAEVKVSADVPGFRSDPAPAEAKFKKSGMAAGSGMWLATMNNCLENLAASVKARLQSENQGQASK